MFLREQDRNLTTSAFKRSMKFPAALIFLIPSLAFAREGSLSDKELSLAGVAIGESPKAVIERLGEPRHRMETQDFLNLHYAYPNVRISFSDGVVAGLHSDRRDGCTPMHLCPGDALDKMLSLYGPPLVSKRESGSFYEYYAREANCWLQIPATGKRVKSITVVCQP